MELNHNEVTLSRRERHALGVTDKRVPASMIGPLWQTVLRGALRDKAEADQIPLPPPVIVAAAGAAIASTGYEHHRRVVLDAQIRWLEAMQPDVAGIHTNTLDENGESLAPLEEL